MVPGGQIRPDGSLGTVQPARRRMEGTAHDLHRRMDSVPLPHSQRGIPRPRPGVQPDSVRRGRVGAAGAGRGHAVHRRHRQASRGLRAVPLQSQLLQPRRRHALRPRRHRGAGQRLRPPGHEAGAVLLSGSGLERPQRRRLLNSGEQPWPPRPGDDELDERLGLPRRVGQGLLKVLRGKDQAPGARAADQLRRPVPDLVRHAHDHLPRAEPRAGRHGARAPAELPHQFPHRQRPGRLHLHGRQRNSR